MINKQVPSTHPYFEAKLQKAISVRVLYDTGDDILCIGSQIFHTLLLDLQPLRKPGDRVKRPQKVPVFTDSRFTSICEPF
jgi:hypothetical protein